MFPPSWSSSHIWSCSFPSHTHFCAQLYLPFQLLHASSLSGVLFTLLTLWLCSLLGVLYNQFLSQVDFELLRDHARELGVLVFENPARRLMVVTPAGHSDVKRFWKRQKHSS